MDFFHSHDTLTAIGWILRGSLAFFFLVIVAKVLGRRAISQLQILDFVIALVVGDIIAHPLAEADVDFKGAMITTVVIVILYLGGIFLSLKWSWFRVLITHPPVTIIKDGEILYQGLKQARISIDMILEKLRQEKISDVKKVALAISEAGGKFSVFLDPKYEPLTPALCKLETEPFNLPRTIIKDGKINATELKETHKDERWVITHLERFYQTEVKNVLLATLDRKENLHVFLYK
ncbi:DUF421 domain-containing protein [Peribacillus sp. SCS-155]|uniref:DUF421 domain-containing protein n=1 Tax=Peribacillus sedimenti TaxID=3115297 RepID=UPI003905F6CE